MFYTVWFLIDSSFFLIVMPFISNLSVLYIYQDARILQHGTHGNVATSHCQLSWYISRCWTSVRRDACHHHLLSTPNAKLFSSLGGFGQTGRRGSSRRPAAPWASKVGVTPAPGAREKGASLTFISLSGGGTKRCCWWLENSSHFTSFWSFPKLPTPSLFSIFSSLFSFYAICCWRSKDLFGVRSRGE